MLLPTISEMWSELIQFDHSLRVVYHRSLHKTVVENDYIQFSIEDHIDAAIYAAWLIIHIPTEKDTQV